MKCLGCKGKKLSSNEVEKKMNFREMQDSQIGGKELIYLDWCKEKRPKKKREQKRS